MAKVWPFQKRNNLSYKGQILGKNRPFKYLCRGTVRRVGEYTSLLLVGKESAKMSTKN